MAGWLPMSLKIEFIVQYYKAIFQVKEIIQIILRVVMLLNLLWLNLHSESSWCLLQIKVLAGVGRKQGGW